MSNSWNNNGTVRNSRNSREGAKKRRLEDAYENAKKVIQRLKEAIEEIEDDGKQGVAEVELLLDHLSDLTTLDVSADGKMVIVASYNDIWIIDNEHYTMKPMKVDGNLIFALKFIPGKPLAVAAVGGALMLVNLEKGEPLNYLGPANRQVLQIAVSRDGRTVIAGQTNGCVTSWDLANTKENWSRIVFAGGTHMLAITDDQQHVWCGSCCYTVYKLDMKNGDVIRAVETAGRVLSLAAVPRTNNVVVRHASMFEIVGDCKYEIARCANSKASDNICVTNGGDILLVSAGNLIHAFYMDNLKKPASVYSGHTAEVISIVIMPDDEHFVSSGEDGTVRLWKLQKRGG